MTKRTEMVERLLESADQRSARTHKLFKSLWTVFWELELSFEFAELTPDEVWDVCRSGDPFGVVINSRDDEQLAEQVDNDVCQALEKLEAFGFSYRETDLFLRVFGETNSYGVCPDEVLEKIDWSINEVDSSLEDGGIEPPNKYALAYLLGFHYLVDGDFPMRH